MDFDEAFGYLARRDAPDVQTEREAVRVVATYITRYLNRYFGRLPEDIKKDVVQEVLCVIQEKGVDARHPKAFTLMWSRNKALKALKDLGKFPQQPEGTLEPKRQPGCEEGSYAEPLQRLAECLRALSHEELYVIEGQFFEDPKKTIRDLAAELGRPAPTTSDLKQRALRKLARCLEEKGIDLDWLQDK